MNLAVVMIVKNEAHIIRRCLEAVRPYIDSYVICDTGSTDSTMEIIREVFQDLPGILFEEPFRDFGYNRSLLLERAYNRADYLFLLDADHIVTGNLDRSELSADLYYIQHQNDFSFYMPGLISGRKRWKMVGLTHEYLVPIDHVPNTRKFPDLQILDQCDGGCRDEKLERDLRLLTDDSPRSIFYRANTYLALGDLEPAAKEYRKRIKLGGFPEEIYWSMYCLALCLKFMSDITWIDMAWKAHRYRPTRLEALFLILQFYRKSGNYEAGRRLGKYLVPIPEDILFVKTSIYEFEFQQELDRCYRKFDS